MEKFAYNNLENLEGMNIKESYEYKIDNNIYFFKELEYFQL